MVLLPLRPYTGSLQKSLIIRMVCGPPDLCFKHWLWLSQVTTFMTMSIITSIACFFQFIIAVIGAEVVNHEDLESCFKFSRPRGFGYPYYAYVLSSLPDAAIDICDKVRAQIFFHILVSLDLFRIFITQGSSRSRLCFKCIGATTLTFQKGQVTS